MIKKIDMINTSKFDLVVATLNKTIYKSNDKIQ